MENLVERIDLIQEKISHLLHIRDGLVEDNRKLELQLKSHKQDIIGLENQVELLKKDNRDLKTANALLGSNDFKRETKFKINSLIKEIDHCISQLSE